MTTDNLRGKKVDRAFEVIEGLEKSEKKETSAKKPDHKKAGRDGKGKRSGLQIKFSLDALISERDTQASPEKDLRPGASNLLNFDFTVPYVWRIPVIGKTALRVVKYLQAEENTESIRDILNSFKKKKPL
ncbi:MAG: hypothetical protein M0Z56_07030 [Desulfobacteraceae bacterium]|nr:hypothetical protein [Desulfobacteraceae bacterium]